MFWVSIMRLFLLLMFTYILQHSFLGWGKTSELLHPCPRAQETTCRRRGQEIRNRANTVSWIGRDCCTRDLTGSVAACQGLHKITSFNIPLWRGRGTRESTPPMELHPADGFSGVASQFHWRVWFLVGWQHSSGWSHTQKHIDGKN